MKRRLGFRAFALGMLGAALLTLGALAGDVQGAGAATTCPICGMNLILNPGAELGTGTSSDSVVKVPDWKLTKGSFTAASYAWSGGDLTATTPGPPNRGKNYFYGGPNPTNNGPVGEATQAITLTQAASAIAGGKLTATLSGWLGGLGGQRDNAKVTVTFLGATGQTLGTLELGPVPARGADASKSALQLKTTTGPVPKGTTSAQVAVILTRLDGSDNDGMADNLSLALAG